MKITIKCRICGREMQATKATEQVGLGFHIMANHPKESTEIARAVAILHSFGFFTLPFGFTEKASPDGSGSPETKEAIG